MNHRQGAYEAGRLAAKRGTDRGGNPFSRSAAIADMHDAWERGYSDYIKEQGKRK